MAGRALRLAAGLGALMLGGCSLFGGGVVDELVVVEPVGSPFTQRLTREYRDFALYERDEMFDFFDAEHFALKGLKAARGEAVLPEDLGLWRLPEERLAGVAQARARLMGLFDREARELLPDLAAVAQARFDCWVEQQEEDLDSDDIRRCRMAFLEAASEIEEALADPQPEPVPPVGTPPPPPAGGINFLVFFDFDRATLNAAAVPVVDTIATEVRRLEPATILITGHADRSGDPVYNRRLSLRRTETVRRALADRGLPITIMIVEALGESEPLVPTGDGVREPANRRVSVSFR